MSDQVGSAWTREAQVDVVGINTMEKTIVLGECKWQTAAVGRRVLRDLVDKTEHIVPKHGQWQVSYLGFARAGWTAAAQAYAAAADSLSVPANANWRPTGMKLLDLAQVDEALTQWVRAA
jgi:hypothetical protein